MIPYSVEDAVNILKRTPDVLSQMTLGLPEKWIHANEGPETWSAFDIVGHFIEGELKDWIPRAKIILSDAANKTFEPFDRFAQEQASVGKTLAELLEEFRRLRMETIAELEALELTEADFSREGTHPDLGTVNLQQLLSTWVVHDFGHIAQLARVMAHQYGGQTGPWSKYLSIVKKP